MPDRLVKGKIEYISRLPNSSKNKHVPILISKASKAHLDFWHAYMQPEINKDHRRADVLWNWPVMGAYYKALATANRQKPEMYAFGIDHKSDFIPIGLSLFLKKYPALHLNDGTKAFYVWFLASAPKKVIEKITNDADKVPHKTGELIVDTLISKSINDKMFGRIGLHASPHGGTCLLLWYRQVGLKNLSANIFLPRSLLNFQTLGKNDGRFFYTNQGAAFSITKNYDHLRT